MLTHTAMYVVFVLGEKINQGKAPSLTAATIPKFLKIW